MLLLCLLLPISVFAAQYPVEINETNFPDATFRNYIVENFDTVKDNVLSEAEIKEVKSIDLFVHDESQTKVTDLKGIEYFVNLETLNIRNNELTSLDVSNNTALTELDFSGNQIATIDLTHNAALKNLACTSNKLTELNLTNNSKLEWIECDKNKLTELNVSKNTKLRTLRFDKNSVKSIDLSKNANLAQVSCAGNGMSELDVSNNPLLWEIYCADNELTSLNLENNAKLERLYVSGNKLTSLDISKNTIIYFLDCQNNNLKTLTLGTNDKLESVFSAKNNLTSMDFSKTPKVSYIDFSENAYEIKTDSNNKFDLSTLPGTFNVSKTSDWVGGKVSGYILTVDDGVSAVTYKYDAGFEEKITFTLNIHKCVFDQQIVSDEFKASNANCTESATYYKSCSCGKKGTETFKSGNPLNHLETTKWQKDKTGHWQVCGRGDCNTVITEKTAHIPDREKATDTESVKCTVCGYEIEPCKNVALASPKTKDQSNVLITEAVFVVAGIGLVSIYMKKRNLNK